MDEALASQLPLYVKMNDLRGVTLWSIDLHKLNGQHNRRADEFYIALVNYAGSSGTELKQYPQGIHAINRVSKFPSGAVAPCSGLGCPVSPGATTRHEDAGEEF